MATQHWYHGFEQILERICMFGFSLCLCFLWRQMPWNGPIPHIRNPATGIYTALRKPGIDKSGSVKPYHKRKKKKRILITVF